MLPSRKLKVEDIEFTISRSPGTTHKYDWSIRCKEIGSFCPTSNGMTDKIIDSFCCAIQLAYDRGVKETQTKIKEAIGIGEEG